MLYSSLLAAHGVWVFTPFLHLAQSSVALQTEIQDDLLHLNTELKEKTFILHLGKWS